MKCGYCGKDFAESQHHYCPEGQRFLLAELARLRAVNAELVEVLRELQRCAQKQGFNDRYETTMGRVQAALSRAEQAEQAEQAEGRQR